jgi:hypothetical protein
MVDEYNGLDRITWCWTSDCDYILFSSKNIGFKNKLKIYGLTLVNGNEQLKIYVLVVQIKLLYFIIKEIYDYAWCCVMFSMLKCC